MPRAPIYETLITKKLFEDEYAVKNARGDYVNPVDESVGIAERSAVVIMNPTKYTVRDDDLPSANEDFQNDILNSI
jgi:hypothetical protein